MLALAGGFFDGLWGLVLSHKLALRQVVVQTVRWSLIKVHHVQTFVESGVR
jgi:hypothetical protein